MVELRPRARALLLPLALGPLACAAPGPPGPYGARFHAPARPTDSWSILPPDGRISTDFEPSGLVLAEGRTIVVSDRPDHRHLYALEPAGSGALRAVAALPLREPAGRPSDFEGVCFDGSRFLIAEESSASLVAVDEDGVVERHPIDVAPLHARTSDPTGTAGAGFEGIACDPAGDRLYLALERQYRTIYVLSLGELSPEGHFDVPAGWNLPRREQQPDGRWFEIYPDFSGLHFEDGYLYALMRNDAAVLKIDPRHHQLVGVLPLAIDPDLYRTNAPYGLAEGLALEGGRVLVVLDNGQAARSGTPDDRRAMLLEFARPAGF